MTDPVARRTFGPNDWLVDEMYEQYRADPSSVSESWQDFFADYQRPGANGEVKTAEPEAEPPKPKAEPKAEKAEEKPAPKKEAPEGAEILRGPAAAIARNMAASRDVPTATSARVVPAKLLEVNRKI